MYSRKYLFNIAKICVAGCVLNVAIAIISIELHMPPLVLVAAFAVSIVCLVCCLVVDRAINIVNDEILAIEPDEVVIGLASRDEEGVVWHDSPILRTYHSIEYSARGMVGKPFIMDFERGFRTNYRDFVCGETAMVIAIQSKRIPNWKNTPDILTAEMIGLG